MKSDSIGLAWWEKVPLALAATAQSTVVAVWYYRYIDLGFWWMNLAIAVIAGLALDAIVVTTIMGRRMGRDSAWSMAASCGAFLCSALIAVDSYSTWLAWGRPLLHVSYPLMVFLYSQHLASNMHAPARATVKVEAPSTVKKPENTPSTPPVKVLNGAPLSKTALVKRLALAKGISESTAWRKVQAGELSLNGKK